MSKENQKTTLCKTCNHEIAKSASVCPNCGAKIKKPFYKKWWFIVVVVIVILSAVANSGDDTPTSNTPPVETVTENTSQPISSETPTEAPTEAPTIEYTAYSVSQLLDDLESNALSAEKKYDGQYVELTGKINVIDSDGDYISLVPSNSDFSIISVQCYIKNEEQLNKVLELSKGDTITLRGKIKSVGEILGYSLDIDNII
ncbi:MAG: hypothetical protein E7397_03885 [Ruminococcaceae bacterium]|nr:hypothetical protein [Oscillospiraceae bacterium]